MLPWSTCTRCSADLGEGQRFCAACGAPAGSGGSDVTRTSANSFATPYFLNAWNLSDATFNFTEKAMIAFAMALLIISGGIEDCVERTFLGEELIS